MSIRRFVLGLTVLMSAAFLAFTLLADETAEGRRYALVVGVQNYDGTGLGNLRYCDNDASGLAETLGKLGYRVTLLTKPEWRAKDGRDDLLPTADNIRDHLKALLRNRKPADTVLLAFAGHGEQLKNDGKMYFCPAKCNLDKPETLVGLDEVYGLLKENAAGAKVLIVDACRNDPLAGRAVGSMNLESVTRPELPDPPGGTVALFGCSKNQVAYESDALKHGYLFHFVIDGLKGKAANKKDGRITWLGLAKHVDDELADAVVKELGPQAVQTPEVRGEARGLVLARLDAASAPPDAILTERDEKEEITNTIGMKLKRIKAGKFLMGSPTDEADRSSDEGPRHEVEIGKAFYMGVYPVTRGQFAVLAKDADYTTEAEAAGEGYGYNRFKKGFDSGKYSWRKLGFEQTDEHPVVEVTWKDATAFCAWLSKKEGQHYELPTEAEWEYACRAGTQTRFWCGDEESSLKGNANIADASFKEKYPGGDWAVSWDDGYAFTSPVGSFKANAWDLYDMHGNVWQWCADYYDKDYYQKSDKKDPRNSSKSDARVLRGGSWDYRPRDCRAAFRRGNAPDNRDDDYGFRVVFRLD